MQILNKLSVKSVCGELKGNVKEGEEKEVMQIIGVAKSKESYKGTFGESWRIKGEFKARNLLTKEEFYAGECFLPGLAEGLVIGQMSDSEPNELQFAFVIGIKYSAKGATGYEFTLKPLLQPAENNALAAIERKLLSAPETTNAA